MKKWQRALAAAGMVSLLAATVLAIGQARPSEGERMGRGLLYWNETESLPVGLYVRVGSPKTRPLRDGDYVVYRPPEAARELGVSRGWMQEDTAFLKQVGALGGESWSIDEELNFFANGRPLGKVYARDREGRPMPYLIGSFEVPAGCFLPVGTAPRSFDGRYTGPVSIESVQAIVLPVLTGIHW